jgi:hypothetical protein
MNLFEEIENLSGEELANALLRHLLLRSPSIRSAIIDAISIRSPIGLLSSTSHFSCYREYATLDEEHGAGRIDLILEVDEAVIGIESKLFAHFQPGQPQKYLNSLAQLSEGLSEVRGRTIRSLLVVLAPLSRRGEIENLLGQSASGIFIAWEELAAAIQAVRGDLDPGLAMLATEYLLYLEGRTAFLPKLDRLIPYLLARFENRGTDSQRDFMRRIKEVFPNPGTVSSGTNWIGFHFSPDDEISNLGWVGFVDASRVEEGARGARFVVAFKNEVETDSDYFDYRDFANPIWIQRRRGQCWDVNLDTTWSTPEIWATRFAPFFEVAMGEE